MATALGALPLVAQINPSLLAGLQWRNVGPFRAGRAGAVCGVPGQLGVYYFGAMQGGFWKSTSSGHVWTNITDKTVPEVAGISVCAVAGANPDEVFFSSNARGPGMFRSTDGGSSWQHVGPIATAILIDPKNANLVIVGRTGAEGGVFRSTDGGVTFRRSWAPPVGGVASLQWAYDNPSVIYATSRGAGGRGGFGGGAGGRGAPPAPPVLYRSGDEGQSFEAISPQGLPALGPFSVSGRTNSQRLYTAGRDGIFRSDDGGRSWAREAGPDQMYTANGLVYADPADPDKVYILGTAVYRSVDGGKTLKPYKGSPGGDDPREWWIDPLNANNILYGGDQGASLSQDGGKTWAPWYNQPTAQIYHLAVDNRFPYWIYGSQQDSDLVATRNRGDFGQINPWDWIPFPGWEASQLAVDPTNPNVVYANANYGDLGRMWLNTWDSQVVDPFPLHDGVHRNGNSPIHFDPLDPHALYFATQYLMVSHDGAQSFTKASPDLTVKPGTTPPAAVPGRGARGGASIGEFAISPVRAGVIWAATSNGLLWTTAGDAHTWQDITPADWRGGVVTGIEPSHLDANEAYVAVRRGGGRGGIGAAAGAAEANRPYVYRTRDGGKSWQLIVQGLPADQSTGSWINVVREDPAARGLLFVGTETEVEVSLDDGGHWQSLRLNAPNTSWRDLVVHTDPASHQTDLVAATYGRSFWVLDDIAPLRALAARAVQVAGAPLYLFAPTTAVRLQRDNNYDTPLPPEVPHALNPPEGAILYYWLGAPAQAVTIEVRDAQNRLVRTLSNVPDAMPLDILGAVPEPWKRVPQGLATTPGMHRVNWDLRWATPNAMVYNYDYEMSAIYHDTPPTPQGPKAVPGRYTLRLTVDGKSMTQPLTVIADPRLNKLTVTQAGMERQLALELKLVQAIDASHKAFDQLTHLHDRLAGQDASPELARKLAAIQGPSGDAVSDPYGTVPGAGTISHDQGAFVRLLVAVDYNSDRPPVEGQIQTWRDTCANYNSLLAQWRTAMAQAPAGIQAGAPPAALDCR